MTIQLWIRMGECSPARAAFGTWLGSGTTWSKKEFRWKGGGLSSSISVCENLRSHVSVVYSHFAECLLQVRLAKSGQSSLLEWLLISLATPPLGPSDAAIQHPHPHPSGGHGGQLHLLLPLRPPF